MIWSAWFVMNSVLFGIGLAMDAFCVSLANGIERPDMPVKHAFRIAGTFAFFQVIMPLIGWFCVRRLTETFTQVIPFIPWVALLLLVFLGGRMLREGLRGGPNEEVKTAVSHRELFVQGIATSIDALSVGFTIAELSWQNALVEALIIGAVTLGICLSGIRLGRLVGMKLGNKASVVGGVILIAIGLEIFIKGVFF